jgi:fermentation-respiration switch protein FrsA (DUF1100 family)
MKYFRIHVVDTDPETLAGVSSVDYSIFQIDTASWDQLLKRSGKNIISSAELRCGVCGSFTVPATVFLKAVERYEDVEDFDPNREIYHNLIEPKFDNDEDFFKYWRNGGPDKALLHGADGDWVYDEITGYPLGLKYEEVVVLLYSEHCQCCETLFLS